MIKEARIRVSKEDFNSFIEEARIRPLDYISILAKYTAKAEIISNNSDYSRSVLVVLAFIGFSCEYLSNESINEIGMSGKRIFGIETKDEGSSLVSILTMKNRASR